MNEFKLGSKKYNHEPIKFSENSKGLYKKTLFGDKYHLIEQGDIPLELQETVNPILDALYNNRNSGRMCNFYIIKSNTGVAIWVALSGSGDENASKAMQEKLKNIKEIMFIPFASCQQRKILRESSNKPDDDVIKRIKLFKKFLQESINSLENKKYKEVEEKFSLNPEAEKLIQKLKSALENIIFKKTFEEFKKDKGEKNEDDKLDLLISMFFRFRKIDFQDLEKKDVSFKITVEGKELTAQVGFEAFFKKYKTMVADQFEADELSSTFDGLWSQLAGMSNFEISQLLAGCAETNLFNYLYAHHEILERPGDHYIFPVKLVKDHNYQCWYLCEVCQVSFPEHLRNIGLKINSKINHREMVGIIPTRTITREEKQMLDTAFPERKRIKSSDKTKEITPKKETENIINRDASIIFLPKLNNNPVKTIYEAFDELSAVLHSINLIISMPIVSKFNINADTVFTKTGWRITPDSSKNSYFAFLTLRVSEKVEILCDQFKKPNFITHMSTSNNLTTIRIKFNKSLNIQNEIEKIILALSEFDLKKAQVSKELTFNM